MNVTKNEKVQTVYAPSINKLIDALQKMELAGVDSDAPIVIAHLANAVGTFAIYELHK